MTLKPEKDRIEKILHTLKSAASGDYSQKLDFASDDDELGLIADAVNTLLQKTNEKLLSARQASSDLAEDAGRYRHILDNIEESYFEVDLQGNLIFFNETVIRDLGYTQDDLRGINFNKLVDEANARKVYETFHRVFLTGQPVKGFDWEILKKNKEKIDVESSVSLLRDETGRPAGFRGVVRNISQRIQAQKDLQQNEQKYCTILEIMGEGYFETDINGRITFVNDAGCNLVGYRREELIGTIYNRYASPETAKRVSDVYHGIYKTGIASFMLDYGVILKDGSIRIHQQNIALMHDESGRPKGFRVLVRDVTERKKAEDALRESEALYRKALETTSDGVSILQEGKYVYINPRFMKTMGIPETYPIDEPLGALMHPDDRKTMQRYYEKRLGGETTPGKHEVRVIKPDQTLIYLQVTSVDIIYQGKPALLSFMQDVTRKKQAENALKESEKRYRTMTENVNDIVWIINLNLQITYVSPSNMRLTGYAPEEVYNMPLDHFVAPDSLALAARTLSEELSLETGGKPFDPNRAINMQLEVHSRNGDNVWLEVSATFNRDTNGKAMEILAVGRNVTQRRNIEKALAESEKRYRMMAENISDIIWTIGPDLRFIYVSPSSTRVTGYTPDETRSTPLNQLLTPDSFVYSTGKLAEEMALEASGKPFDPNRAVTLEVEAIHKNGSSLWLEVTGTFNRNRNGEITEILAVGKNITERKKIENDLRESEKRYRMIVENVHDSIALLDLNLDYLYISPSEIRITGYTHEEMIHLPLKNQLTPESYRLVEKIFTEELERESSGTSVDSDRSRTMELEVYHKNGGAIWVESTATAQRDINGKPVGLMVITRDITERRKAQEDLKKSEQRYRMIIENMHEVIWTTDLNFQYTYVSPSCLWVTGYTPEEIMSLSVGQLLTPESFTLAQNALEEEITHEFSGEIIDPYRSRTIEQELHHKNGGRIWMDVTATFTRDENDKPVGMLMAGKEITARKKAEAERNKLAEQLIQAQKMETVGRLAGGVAHDFNNMLSVILGYVDLAKLRLARQHPVLKDLAEIEKAAVHSRDITSQLLAFSRKQIIEPKIIDLNELVSHTEKALIRLIGEDIDLKVIQEKHLRAILFDPSQIEQILINLAVNARDAMQNGGKLTIETANIVLDTAYCENNIGFTPGLYVRLSFSDNGVGMDQETLQHIFEPFFTTKGTGKGTGLGLATVYGIVRQNHGFIHVYSEPEHGTTFTLYLPCTAEEREVQEVPDEEMEIAGRGNILLVEDDAMVLQITTGLLESLGYEVLAVNNPLDALSLCKNPDTPIDLVISDVVMPVMSGKELRNNIVAIRPGLKLIFISGYTADVIAHHGVLEEGVLFLQKPFTIKALAGKVREVLALKPP